MHLAVVGAGALGRVYGARLALLSPVSVSFVVRPERVSSSSPILLERVDERDDVLRLDGPVLVSEIPKDADLVVVCVRAEQLDERLVDLIERGPDVPAVMMTPMMPGDYERLRTHLGTRVVAAMPGVVAYVREDDVVRYWIPKVAPTMIEETAEAADVLSEFVHSLQRAHLPAKRELGIHESNPATTVTFIPLMMAIDAGGGVDSLLANDELLDLALRAAHEGKELALRIGKVAAWASMFTKFATRTTLKIGVGIARHQSPEAVRYVETHFGKKLHAQNVAMAAAIVRLAQEKGTPHEALTALQARLF
jgi:2-dehydropantoate 2-reductase